MKSRKRQSKTFTCPICNAKFSQQASLSSHILCCQNGIQLLIRPYKSSGTKAICQCTVCSKAFKTAVQIHTHIRKTHAHEATYKCQYCQKTFDCMSSLWVHNKGHNKAPKYRCILCEAKFVWERSLKRHIVSVHAQDTEKSKKFNCQDCKAEFKSQNGFYNHRRTVHVSEEQGPCKCDVCGADFKCQPYLQRHIRGVHSIPSFNCIECSYSCRAKYTLRRHEQLMHAKGPPVKCPICRKLFTGKVGMLSHKQKVHTAASFSCANCDFLTKYRYDLVRHMRRRHLGDDAHRIMLSCDQCSVTFSRKDSLQKHVRTIHAAKKWQCEVCEAIFRCQAHLESHNRKIHAARIFKYSDFKTLTQT